jgi:uncharacterized ferritin-like protein (DUF455 family)
MIDRVSDAGDSRFADILKIILRDEIRHVRSGSRWFQFICSQRGLDSVATFDTILRQYKADLNAHVNGPFHIAARLQAGFSEAELSQLQYESQ